MQLSNENLKNKIKWESLFKYTLPFLPFCLYLLTSLGLLPIGIMPVVLVIAIAALLVWGLWKVWRGVTNKDGREVANGVSPLAFAVLAILYYRGILDINLFFYLLIFSVGVGWLLEKLLLKVWE
jgi:hypothetical protein